MSPASFILDQSKVFAPKSLLTMAKTRAKVARVVISYCHSKSAISGAKQAFDLDLIEPIFVGPRNKIEKEAKNLDWDISNFRAINASEEEKAGDISAALCGNGEADILMKGDLHSDTFMRSVIARKNNLRTRNKTAIKKSTSGKIARTPSTISTRGVFSQIEGSVCMVTADIFAAAIISSGEIVSETNIAKTRTAKIGKREAIVTTPKPERDELPFPAALAIPIPKERTKGTVTGPVVTAPQSHAKPRMLFRFGSNHA